MSNSTRYPEEVLNQDYEDDDGTMSENVFDLESAVIGHRIVKAEKATRRWARWRGQSECLVITLDNGHEVQLANTSEWRAFTELEAFLLHPEMVDHIILGVGTTEQYSKWHIYADLGDILELTVGWSCGNPFYYGYGFDINVVEIGEEE